MVQCWDPTRGGAVFVQNVGRLHEFSGSFGKVDRHLWHLLRDIKTAEQVIAETAPAFGRP
jgi:hypothetical protein